MFNYLKFKFGAKIFEQERSKMNQEFNFKILQRANGFFFNYSLFYVLFLYFININKLFIYILYIFYFINSKSRKLKY